MKMSDKDLDQLFNAQLADLEIEPSAAVWNKIAADIKVESDKKGRFPYMQIAAGITILMTVGLWFTPRQEKISLHGSGNSQQTAQLIVKPNVAAVNYTTLPADAPAASPKRVKTVSNHIAINPETQQVYAQVNSQPDTAQYASNIQPVNTEKPEHIAPAIKTNANTLTAIAKADIPVKQPVRALAVADIPKLTAPETAKKKKIHTLGDILNVVIAKVDKRDNKIIEFSNDDDDEAFTVSGVNLGPLKVKKQN